MRGYRPLPLGDRLCLLGCAGLIVLAGFLDTAMVESDRRAVETARAQAVAEYHERLDLLAEVPPTALQAAQEAAEAIPGRGDIPLSPGLQEALWAACEATGVPVPLALGLMEVESGFDTSADNGVCYGLCQLNRRYYPDGLSPEENIAAGVAHLAGQIKRYGGDVPAALRAYNRGYDDGDRDYAYAVLAAAERWEGTVS